MPANPRARSLPLVFISARQSSLRCRSYCNGAPMAHISGVRRFPHHLAADLVQLYLDARAQRDRRYPDRGCDEELSRNAYNPTSDLRAARHSPRRLRQLHPPTNLGHGAIHVPTNLKPGDIAKAGDPDRESNPSSLCAFAQSPVPEGSTLADAKKRGHRRSLRFAVR